MIRHNYENTFEDSEQHNNQQYKTKRFEQRVQRYFLLNLKQIGRKQRRKRPSTSTACTFPPQHGHAPGATFLPSSFSSSSQTHEKQNIF